MGATNLPHELDEAIIRRLEKRIYGKVHAMLCSGCEPNDYYSSLTVPLPDASTRQALILHLLASQQFSISTREIKAIAKATEGYSGSDLKALCKDAALGPIRELGSKLAQVKSDEVRGINAQDFAVALQHVRASVSADTVTTVVRWNEQYGVSGAR